ncbi:MAG TPA: alpha/beta fold hydrolase [Vicinamibacterales bacterium]|nr:alpha/beta fold hydrolase [Vicinamibacterales bacterium]
MRVLAFILAVAAVLASPAAPARLLADDSQQILTVDHYLRVKSSVPAIAGQQAQLYVRERVAAGMALRARSFTDRVVLFVHGAGTPAEVSFDVPAEDYSWMAYLARAGFDVFSVDMTGYGRSTRPAAMSDPCNLAADRQPAFVPSLIPAPCTASYPGAMTTIGSDWDDVGAAVDYIRALRRVERVSLVAWSLGGPRSGGYAAKHPDKVNRIVWLAPAYGRMSAAEAPAKLPAPGTVFNTQSRAEFLANWDRQVGCPGQYDPAVAENLWSEMLASDPVGATWGPGVRRAPQTTTWGWNSAVVAKMQTPALMVAGVHDKQVDPARVRDLHADLGSPQKVMVDLGCASHNAMWEKGAHTLLFRASLEWLEKGTVNGMQTGVIKLGY